MKFISWTVLTVFFLAETGCAKLKPYEYEEHGYYGAATVEEGERYIVIDWIGNYFGLFPKLILWNWKIKRHYISDETENPIRPYLNDNPTIGDVKVQLNRYAPQDSWKRLFANKRVAWPYRYTIGIIYVLLVDTLFIDRILGSDRYNPFSHTVHIHSDLPSVALHELGHAKDFGERRYKGTYALLRILPFTDLYQEFQATDDAIEHTKEKSLPQIELESYKVLYPAYGTYVGNYIGLLPAVIIGHIAGRWKAYNREKELKRIEESEKKK